MASDRPAALYAGGAVLAATLANRLFFTPASADALAAVGQSRSDLLAVVAASALVLYGLGRVEIEVKTST
jgi:hypothetical protein